MTAVAAMAHDEFLNATPGRYVVLESGSTRTREVALTRPGVTVHRTVSSCSGDTDSRPMSDAIAGGDNESLASATDYLSRIANTTFNP